MKMKKWIAMSLIALLALGLLVGCNDDPNLPQNPSGENESGNEDVNNPAIPPEGSGNGSGEEEDLTASEEMESLITKLNEQANVEVRMPYSQKISALRSQEYIGLQSKDFSAYVVDSIVNESMISPSNHSLCIIKINDTSKKDEIKNTIFENCNPGKWICMRADQVLVADSGDYIMLVMSTKENCDGLYNAFKEEFGAENVSEALTK